MANEISYRSIFGNIDITSYLFSLLVGFGGLFAFIRSGSLMSLLSGLAFAALLSVGSYKTSQNRKDYHFTLSICVCLCLLMGYRYLLTNKFMPAGLISSLSISMIVYLIIRVRIHALVNKKVKVNNNKET